MTGESVLGTALVPKNITFRERLGRSPLARIAAVGLLATGLTVTVDTYDAPPAQATTFANDYPDASMPCEHANAQGQYLATGPCTNYDWGPTHTTTLGDPSTNSPRGYGYRNCVDGVAWWLAHNGVGTIPTNWGSAVSWDNNAPSSQVIDGTTMTNIEPGDVAQSDDGGSGYGHVGFVTDVVKNASGVVTSITTAEMNAAGTGVATLGNVYNTRDSVGKFDRGSGYDWDHFIDINGAGKGLGGDPIGGSGTASPPAYVPGLEQRSNGESDVVAVGADNSLNFWYNTFNTTSWNQIPVLPAGTAYSSPAVMQRSNGETDVVVQGPNHSLEFYYNPFGTSTWNHIPVLGPNSAYSDPAAIQRSNGETDIVVQGPSNSIDFYYNQFGTSTWGHVPIRGASSAYSAAAIAQRSNGETDIVVQGANNSLNFFYNPFGTSTWNQMPVAGNGTAFSDPSLIQRSNGETDVATVGPNNALNFYYNPFGTSTWNQMPVPVVSPVQGKPAMVQRSNGETDIAIWGPNKNLDFYYNTFGTSTWGRIAILGANGALTPPTLIQRSNNNSGESDVVAMGTDNRFDFYYNPFGTSTWGHLDIN